MHLEDAIQEYLSFAKANGLSEYTLRSYTYDLEKFLEFAGNRRVKKLRPADIDEYVIELRTQPSNFNGRLLSQRSIRKRVLTIKRLYAFLIEREYAERNPASHLHMHVDPVDLDAKTISVADLTATIHYIQAMQRNRERNLYAIVALADSGMRVSEVARLQISDVDLSRRIAYVRRSKTQRHQVLPVSPRFAWALSTYLAVRPPAKHDAILTVERPPYHPLTARALGDAFRYWTLKATGRERGPHSVRHSWISEALNNAGVNPKIAQDIAGHADTRMTFAYARPDIEAQRRAIDDGPLLSSAFPDLVGPNEEDNVLIYLDADSTTTLL